MAPKRNLVWLKKKYKYTLYLFLYMTVSNVGLTKTTQGKVFFSSITILLNSFEIFPRVNATAKLHAVLLYTGYQSQSYVLLTTG